MTIFLSILSAIISAVITSYMLQKTEYGKFTFNKRFDIFYDFIAQIDMSLRQTYGNTYPIIMINREHPTKTHDNIVNAAREGFLPLINKAVSIKLILNQEDKEHFFNLVNSLKRLAIEAYSENIDALSEMEKAQNEIELIFEKNLEEFMPPKWQKEFNQRLESFVKSIF